MAVFDIKDHADGVRELILTNAPVNALTAGFMGDLNFELTKMAQSHSVRAVLISSSLKVLSAGLDLKAAQDMDGDAQRAVVQGLDTLFPTLFALPKPTVVAASGSAIAGGLFFVLGCDWRVGGSNAQFGLAEVRVGATFPVGPMEIARDQLAPADLRRLMLRGQPYSADQALAAGLIDEISDEPHRTALLRATELASIPPQTYASVKAQTRGPAIDRIKSGLANQVSKDWFTSETRAAMVAMLRS